MKKLSAPWGSNQLELLKGFLPLEKTPVGGSSGYLPLEFCSFTRMKMSPIYLFFIYACVRCGCHSNSPSRLMN